MVVGYFVVEKIEEIKQSKVGTYNFMVDYAKKFCNQEDLEHILKASKINLKNYSNSYVLSWLFNEKIIDYMLLNSEPVDIEQTMIDGEFFDSNEIDKKRNNFCNKCDDWLRNIGYYNESDEAFWKYKIYIKEAVKTTPTLITEFSLLNGNKLKKAPQSFYYTLN